MPLTFPSHAAAVLPLKMWRPRWFDGVALVVGSAAPDFPYALDPYLMIRAHTWWGLLWFCVPVTVAVSWLVRRAAPAVAVTLPAGGPLALGAFAVLGRVRYRWYVTAGCAWLGALTHRLWDMVTHASIDRGTVRFAWLSAEAFAGQPWWRVLHYGSTVAGAVAVLLLLVHVGRRRALVTWHGRPPGSPRRTGLFWAATAAVSVPGAAVQPLLAGHGEIQILFVRLLAVAGLALYAAAEVAGRGRLASTAVTP